MGLAPGALARQATCPLFNWQRRCALHVWNPP